MHMPNHDERPLLQPNMLAANLDVQSSSFARIIGSHSIHTESSYLNCLFNRTNFQGSSFFDCDLDGVVFEGSRLRAVNLINCEIDELTINGIRVGALLKQLMEGAPRADR